VDAEKVYTVEEGAWILKPTSGRIRPVLRAGELEGHPPEALRTSENSVKAKLGEFHFHALRWIALVECASSPPEAL